MPNHKLGPLRSVIERHLPVSELGEAGETFAVFAAVALIEAALAGPLVSGKSFDADCLPNLKKKARQLRLEMKQLDGSTQVRLGSYLSKSYAFLAHYKTSRENAFELGLFFLEQLEHAVDELRGEVIYCKKADRKRNWKAISVVAECRDIWASWAWLKENGNYPRVEFFKSGNMSLERLAQIEQEFASFRDDYAPRSAHNDRPGPFGTFVQDVFEVLGICAADGQPVRAGTALAALATLKS